MRATISKPQIIKNATENLLKMFESGQMPEAIALTYIRRKAGDDQPSFHWTISNQILALCQGSTDARGYQQWQQVGRHVKKGRKAIWIFAPITRTIEDEDGNKQVIFTGFKQIPVYRYEDTEGKELIRPDYAPLSFPPLWDVPATLGVSVKYVPLTGQYYGKYNHTNKEIVLCSQDPSIFYHELGHAVHATIKSVTGGQIAEQEIVAEMAAAVLCELQGITGYENHAYDYIKSYNNGKKPESVLPAVELLYSIYKEGGFCQDEDLQKGSDIREI